MTENVISFTNLGHAYRPGTWVFRNYAATVNKGEVFALLGPNGRGKTTLLKLLLGALKPSEGDLSVKGHFAFVPQLFQVSFDYSCLDMVLMGRAKKIGLFSQPGQQDEEAALEALDRFGMADYAHRPFHELSGGQRQLVIFARALVAEADILILDEPTSALDLKNQALILDWIGRLSRKESLTIIMTTHHPHHALAVADQALLMLGQAKHIVGAPSEVLTEENLTALYGVPMKRVGFEHEGRRVETLAHVLPTVAAAEVRPTTN
ncbi:ABC transporter ATP-binding protein [Methyloferula stellata]|uniref:ABC transporter ATP-binding protein n=1 Tax=Methyloferula stellata TaxID=876270 RepID=UPI000377B5E9|nr:ABC transporter ATP-binding protein [Methyloferula stellata]